MKFRQKPLFRWTLRGVPYLYISLIGIAVTALAFCLKGVLLP